MQITKPEVLTEEHNIDLFVSGRDILDEWLKKRALKNQNSGASKTFVICSDTKVIGYYALASGSVERESVPKSLARSMPQPIPVIILARMAIDVKYQGKRLGKHLLKNVLQRCIFVSGNIGVRALLVHALDAEAKRFYEKYGFQVSPLDDMTLLMSMKNLYKIFQQQ